MEEEEIDLPPMRDMSGSVHALSQQADPSHVTASQREKVMSVLAETFQRSLSSM